jgi:fatty-acid peroxygenase
MSLQSFVAKLPQVHLPDDTLAQALEGYAFISNRCRELGADVFETRLMLQRTVCMRGAEAAQRFYDPDLIQRDGATPNRIQSALFSRGGVQHLDGAAHRARKHLYVSLLGPLEVERMRDLLVSHLRAASERWTGRTVLFDELQDVLARVACAWSGLAIDEDRRIRDLATMGEGLRGRVSRARAEWWIMRQLEQVRGKALTATGALRTFADSDLDARTAAIEVLSTLRPIVAVARYFTFAALALHEYPHARELVHSDSLVEPFVQEVRRFYPFFPPTAGRARRAFELGGIQIAEGTRVVLDLHATNHDPHTWPDPDRFRPERFVGWRGDPFTLIPQGGGDVATGHRCPGEMLTIELMKTFVHFVTHEVVYEVFAQDLSVPMARVPTLPTSRFVIENVKRRT